MCSKTRQASRPKASARALLLCIRVNLRQACHVDGHLGGHLQIDRDLSVHFGAAIGLEHTLRFSDQFQGSVHPGMVLFLLGRSVGGDQVPDHPIGVRIEPSTMLPLKLQHAFSIGYYMSGIINSNSLRQNCRISVNRLLETLF